MADGGILWTRYSELAAWKRVGVKGAVETMHVLSVALSLAPLAVLPYLAVAEHEWSLVEILLTAWAALELVCRAYVYSRVVRMERVIAAPLVVGRERIALAKRLVCHMASTREIAGWFAGSEEVGYDALDHFVTMLLFERQASDLSGEELLQAKQIVDMFRARHKGLPDRPHREANLLWPSKQPIPYTVRSVLYYGTAVLLKTLTNAGFYFRGIRWHGLKHGLGYWIHQPKDSPQDSQQVPILYFHGIGLGPGLMLPHIASLMAKYPCRTIIVFYLPHISLAFGATIATEPQVLEAIDMLFAKNNLRKVSVVGHSFGTLAAAWVVRGRPSYVARVTLIDPVCYMLWSRSLQQRAYFAAPTTLIHHLVSRFISRDYNYAVAMWRTMSWPYSMQFVEDLPCPASIFLSRRDWVIDAPATFTYLHDRKRIASLTHVNVHMFDLDHLEFMTRPSITAQINCVI